MQTLEKSNVRPGRLAYSRVEAAEILGQSPATVDRLADRGLLKPSRATGRPMYPIWELERFLRETSEGFELASVGHKQSRPRRRGKAGFNSSPSLSGSGGVGTKGESATDTFRGEIQQ